MPDPAEQAADDPNSRAIVDTRDAASIAHWAEALGLTTEALESAVKAVGPRVDRIKDHLTGGMAGTQQEG
jgi:hypothetical protein